MPDIFDQVAPDQTAKGGDIFDQVASTPAPRASYANPGGARFAKDIPMQPDFDAPALPNLGPPKQSDASIALNRNQPYTPPQTNRLKPLGGDTVRTRIESGVAPRPMEQGPAEAPLVAGAPNPNPNDARVQPVASGLQAAVGGEKNQPADPQVTKQLADLYRDSPDSWLLEPTVVGPAEVGKGVDDLAESGSLGGSPGTGGAALPNDKPQPVDTQRAFRGGTELMSGIGKIAAPLIPEEFAAASALGKIKLAGGFLAGGTLSAAGGKMLDHTNLQHDTKEFIKSVLWFAPSAATPLFEMAAKPTITHTTLPDGSQGVEYSAFGGKVKAQAATTPEAVGVGAKVGPYSAKVVKPRGGGVEFSAEGGPPGLPGEQAPPPPPSAGELLVTDQQNSAVQAMGKAQASRAAAAAQVAGIPPPQPPQKAQPAAMANGSITPEIEKAVGTLISAIPPQQRAAAMKEAAGNLTDWIVQQPGMTFVDAEGKLQRAKDPLDAAQLAIKMINSGVDRHQAAQDEAQKQAEQAQKDAEKQQADAQKAQEQQQKETEKYLKTKNENDLTPAEELQARVKTILDPMEGATNIEKASALQRRLSMGFNAAKAAVDAYHGEQVPTVGSKQQPVVEESKATVDAQLDALKAGTVHTVMIPSGSKYQPEVPPGMKFVDIPDSKPGAGRYIFNPKLIKVGTIRTAAAAGTHGDLLGHISTKDDIANAQQSVIVQAHKPDGTPIQDSEVDASRPDIVKAQAEILHERHPDAHISVKPTAQVIAERQQPHDFTKLKELTDRDAALRNAEPRVPTYVQDANANGLEIAREYQRLKDAGAKHSEMNKAGINVHIARDWASLFDPEELAVGATPEQQHTSDIFDSLGEQDPTERKEVAENRQSQAQGGETRPTSLADLPDELLNPDRWQSIERKLDNPWGNPVAPSGRDGFSTEDMIALRDAGITGRDHRITGVGIEKLYQERDRRIAERRKSSLAEQGTEATKAAARALNPETTRTEAQQTADAEADVTAQKQQTKLLVEAIGEEAALKYAQENPEQSDLIKKTLALIASEKAGPDVRPGDNQEDSGGSQREAARVAGDLPQGDGASGAGREISRASGELQRGSVEKGDRVRYTDRDGVERSGTVAAKTGLGVRIQETGHFVQTRKILAVEPKEAQTGTNGDVSPHPASLDTSGGGRPSSDSQGGDSASLDAVPQELREGTPEGRETGLRDRPDSAPVREGAASVPESRSEPGPGAGSDSGIDNAPAGKLIKEATAKVAKQAKLVTRNKDWHTTPDGWQPPSGTVGRINANLAAIKLLRELEQNPRKITDEEKLTLSNYVGWGALAHAFDPYNAPWKERDQWLDVNRKLRAQLSPEDFDAARRSTQNAHYTSPELVRHMWEVLKRFGFKGGNVLEPSMGSGNFFGMMPKAIRARTAAIGNELDPTTYGIAKLLYPEATMFNKDFVQLLLPDNSQDVAISNVPFGVDIYDPKYPKLKAKIHDYFFVKSLDKVKPGGVVAFITSTGTMDRVNNSIRAILASKADLIGAVRLPSGAFKKNAGTDVTTDLIFLQKRAPGDLAAGEAWLNAPETAVPDEDDAKNLVQHNLNEYYQNHPEMILGTPVSSTAMYGGARYTVKVTDDFAKRLAASFEALPKGIMREDVRASGADLANTPSEFAPDNVKPYMYTMDAKGNLRQSIDGKLVSPAIVEGADGGKSLTKIQRIKEMVALRDQMNDLLLDMSTLPDDEKSNSVIAGKRAALRASYDKFVKKNGHLNSVANGIFKEDPHYPRLLALEKYDKSARVGTPADIFTKRTIFPRVPLTAVSDNPAEALQQILGEKGFPDVATLSQLTGKSVEEVAKPLLDQGLIYKDPASGLYTTREKYLSGYVRDKLDDARRAVEQGAKEYEPNVAALEKVLPETVKINTGDPQTQIAVRLGATWIPIEALNDFSREVFSTPAKITYTAGAWNVEGMRRTAEVTSTFGTPRVSGDDLFKDCLNQVQTRVMDRDADGKTHLNPEQTVIAQAAQQKIRDAFQKWAGESKQWAEPLEKAYNYAYNNLVTTEYDGSHLTFPGMNPAIKLNAHQVNAVWRILQDGRALLAHAVGAGKTFEMAAAIMEGRRVGIFKKPMLTVPNHIVEQFRQEFLHLYPGANLLVPTEKDFDAKNRQRILSQVATNDYDAVIIPHSQFNLIDISPARQEMTINGQLEELEETIRGMKSDKGSDKRTVKQMEKARDSLRTTLAKLQDLKADKAIGFDDLGVDALFVDEAHAFKNLKFYTKMQRISGLGQSNAKSALRMKMKTEYLQDTNNGRGVIFATGTPVQNTMAELPTMIKYIAPDVLEKAGIRYFDDWAANFGEVITAMELSADGRSYKARSKFARFQNVPELMQMVRSFADIKMPRDLNLPVPKLEGGKPTVVTVPSTPELEAYVERLMQRAAHLNPDPRIDNMLKITSEGRKAATDMRLLNGDPDEFEQQYKDHVNSKISKAVENMYQEWREGDSEKLTQMAFLDMYRALDEDDNETLNLYNDMRNKLAAMGVPREQIAVIGEHDSRVKRQKLFNAVNAGEVRILLGSTQKMGAGTNAQKRLKALHHIDLTWRPGDMEQREGRILRQGNDNAEVRIYAYLTEKSFDAYMAQTLQGKAEFISQLWNGSNKQRIMADVASDMVMNLEEMKVAASGNPDVKKKYDLELKRTMLSTLERGFEAAKRERVYQAQQQDMQLIGTRAKLQAQIDAQEKMRVATGDDGEGFTLDVDGKKFADRKEAMDYLKAMEVPAGNFMLTLNNIGAFVQISRRGVLAKTGGVEEIPVLEYQFVHDSETHQPPDRSMVSLVSSMESRLRQVPKEIERLKQKVVFSEERLAKLKQEDNAPFPQQKELDEVTKELAQVTARLQLGDVNSGSQALGEAVAAAVDETPDDEIEEQDDSEDDADTDIDKPTKRPTGNSGTTLRASVFGLDIAAKWMADQGKKFYDADIAPALSKLGPSAVLAGKQVANFLYPRTGANVDALNAIMKAKGHVEKVRFELEQKHLDGIDKSLEQFFEKMPRDAQIAFIDRIMTGQGQTDPQLQKIQQFMESFGNASFNEIQQYKPSIQARENYYGLIWKTPPDPLGKRTANSPTNPNAGKTTRRPFEGPKQFFKRKSMETISEGMYYGGVPVTTNPWKLFRMVENTKAQYIASQRYWRSLKQLGLRKFVKTGEKPPIGWAKVNDKIARVFFPAASGEGMIAAGEWYAEPSAARLLNNYLSRDYIRESVIGNGLMALKNITTAIELGLSPFHLIFESIEAMGSQFGLGVQRFWNNGMREGNVGEMVHGAKDAATFMAAPVLLSRDGGSLLRYGQNPTMFAQTKRGAAFLKRFPHANQILLSYFQGGGQFSMNPDYRTDPVKSLTEAAKEGNYVSAALRALPAINHWIMKPLFETFIPRLKMGMFLQQYSQRVVEMQDALSSGDTTYTEIAREVNDTVENRFGELNFSNIFWDNTFKSAMQFLFRSITWKLGNWRGLGTAVIHESGPALIDPLRAMYEDARAGKRNHPAKDYVPKLGMNQAWLLGMVVTTAVLGTVVSKLLAHRYPWEMAEEDKAAGYSPAGALLLELTHPRTGKFDPHTGKPDRVSLPTGLKDFEHAFSRPGNYIRSSFSEVFGRLVDTIENRDYFGDYVYDPNGSLYQKFAQVFKYGAPKPIALDQMTSNMGSQDTQSKVIRALGLTGASKELDMSKAEEEMRDINRANHQPLTPEQKEEKAAEREQGQERPTPLMLRRAMRERNTLYVEKLFKGLQYADAMKVFKDATPAEQTLLRPLLIKKRAALLHRDPAKAREVGAFQ